MKQLSTAIFSLALCLSFIATAWAEVFTCKQADGTTVFSHVPCRIEKPIESQPVAKPEPLKAETEFVEKSLEPDILAVESQLDELRKAREYEIAQAPYSTQNPDLLYKLKDEIRANYQIKIDQKLSELVELRTRQLARRHSESS